MKRSSLDALAEEYFLSPESIKRIVYTKKEITMPKYRYAILIVWITEKEELKEFEGKYSEYL